MTEQKLITPRKLSGFMELMPNKQIIFDNMVSKIKEVYARHAFMPLDTPVLELSEILLAKSGGEIDKEVYRFNKGDTDICMRYDLTVPLARFVAMNSEQLSFPFKRYQVGKVYRGERAQKGRFREFVQCDADIIGLDNLPISADAECLIMVGQIFDALGLPALNRISNRNILFGYCEALGYGENTKPILTILDKIGKIGVENAKAELFLLGVSEEDTERLLDLTSKKGAFPEVLSAIENLTDNPVYMKGVQELKAIYAIMKAYGVDESKISLDISIIRGQDYYTGTIFEAILPAHPEFGTVCGGGRYDNLAGYYTQKKLPGVGLSIGLTRLFDLLSQNGMLEDTPATNITLQIIPLGDTLLDCVALQAYFQKEIVCDVNNEERSFKAKMKDAGKKQIPFVLIVGENEVASKTYALKNMATGEQFNLAKEDCLQMILGK